MPTLQDRAGQSEHNMRVDLVFKGGGVKGIGLIGALSVLEERGFEIQNRAGSSAGAIVAVLSAAGYSADELHQLLKSELLTFTSFLDKGWEDRVPGLAGKGLSIILDQGIYEGVAFERWIRAKLEAKGVRSFGQLVHPDFADEPRFRWKAQVIASDVTGRCFLVLPRDAEKLGIAPDDLDVARAVRMSMSIPLFFEPVREEHRVTHETHLIVDGGMLSNFPVWLFDSQGEPAWPTFGLLLVDPQPNSTIERILPPMPKRTDGFATVRFLTAVVKTMLEAHDRLHLEEADFARTIAIDNLGVSTTAFEVSEEVADGLYRSGCAAAESFLDDWSFPRYVEEYRRGRAHSRRDLVNERMRRGSAEQLSS